MELNLDQFSPKQGELVALAAEAKAVTINGIDDKAGYQRASDTRLRLKKTRVEITKTGKALRDDAVKFQRAVIAREKELVAIIEPEEDRLTSEIEAIDIEKVREKRRALLPERRAKLEAVNGHLDDEQLLDMSDEAFAGFYGECVSKYHEAEEAERRKAEAAIIAQREQLEREKADFERQQAEAKERERRALEEEERQAEALAKKQASDKELQAFLERHGATKETLEAGTHLLRQTGGGYSLYELIATLTAE